MRNSILLLAAFLMLHVAYVDALPADDGLTLSEHTKKALASLTQPIVVVVCMGAQHPFASETVELLKEYRAANPKYVTFEYTDPGRSAERANELEVQYGFGKKENVVIVDAGKGNYTVINDDRLADIDAGNKAAGREPRITLFKAEKVVTTALLDLVEGKFRRIYVVAHQDKPKSRSGTTLGLLGDQLASEHLNVDELNTLKIDAVPADASLLMVLVAYPDFTDREIKLLSDYWDKGGRLLVLLNPETPTPHLAGFLTRLGVRPDDDRILGQASVLGVRKLLSGALTLFAGDTTIAVRLGDLTPMFQGSTQSLSITPEAGAATGLKVGPLLQTPKGFWGEVDYKDMETTGAENDPAKDKQYPLIVAATVEKGAVGDQRVQVTSSRMIVFGNARFVEPEVMDQQALELFINSVKWLSEH